MNISRRSLFGLAAVVVHAAISNRAGAQSIQPYPLVPKKSADAKGRFPSQAGKSKAVDTRITEIVAKIDSKRLMANVQSLQDLKTRYSLSANIGVVENWVSKKLIDAGYSQELVELQAFQMPSGKTLHNVLLFPEFRQKPFVLVCAHLDSVSEQPEHLAPGADDNGSGLAMLIELASVLHGVTLPRGVLIAAFNGEEQGLIGSQACAEIAGRDQWPIDLVINMDMIGFSSSSHPNKVVIEYDQGNVVATNDAVAKSFGLQMAQLAADYTSLSVEHTDIWSSDYMPFEAQGFPCVGLYDSGGDESFYHTSADTIENINEANFVQVARLAISSVLSIGGLQAT